MMHSLLSAVNFLTTIPIHSRAEYHPQDLGKAAGWFSWVGALIGLLTAAAYYGLQLVLPRLLAAALAVVVWIVLTGGLHLDGVADCCDGLFCSAPPERRLKIMKDPHHGTFAGLGVTLTIMLKVIALYSLPSVLSFDKVWLVLPFAAALARWLLLPAGRQPSARPGGLGDSFSSGIKTNSYLISGIPLVGLAYLLGWQALAVAATVCLLAWLVLRFARTRLGGGITGDVFGLLVELSELAVLIGFCVEQPGL